MKRPIGVTFSAVILLLGSLLQVLMALGMALTGVMVPAQTAARTEMQRAPIPTWMPVMMYVMSAFVAGLAAWGIVTAIGLFRLRSWARYSVLVIGGCLAFFGLMSMLSTLVMTLVPFTPPPGASGSTLSQEQAQNVLAMTRVVFAVLAFLYGVVCAVGVSWLVYFNRKPAREAFAAPIADVVATGSEVVQLMAPSGRRRPVLIAVIAVLNMIGGVFILISVFLPIPLLAFGFVLHGWAKLTTCIGYCSVQAAVGIGLWRMKEWGRRLTLGVLALGVAQSAFFAFRPSLIIRYSAEVNSLINPVPPPLPERFQSILFGASFGISVLFCLAIAGVLIYYRHAFRPEAAPPGDAAAA